MCNDSDYFNMRKEIQKKIAGNKKKASTRMLFSYSKGFRNVPLWIRGVCQCFLFVKCIGLKSLQLFYCQASNI